MRATRSQAMALLRSGDLLTQTEAAKMLGLQKSTLSYRTRHGYAPMPLGMLGSTVVYWRPDVKAVAAAKGLYPDPPR